MQEQYENANLFLKIFLLWNLMLQLAIIHSFCTKCMGVHGPWLEERKKKNCHWSSLDHVLSIKIYWPKRKENKNLLCLTLCVPGWHSTCCPSLCCTSTFAVQQAWPIGWVRSQKTFWAFTGKFCKCYQSQVTFLGLSLLAQQVDGCDKVNSKTMKISV